MIYFVLNLDTLDGFLKVISNLNKIINVGRQKVSALKYN